MTLMGMGDIRVPALFDAFQATANLVLSLILVRQWGVMGVAWGTLIPAACCELGLLLPYVCRRIGLTVQQLAQESVLPQLPALAALWGYCVAVARIECPLSWFSLLAIAAGGGAVLLSVRGSLYWLTQRQARSVQPQEMMTT
jgi:peptidoglycan biosynthesis protein MviN/MurJ (putative lipid II flippase)